MSRFVLPLSCSHTQGVVDSIVSQAILGNAPSIQQYLVGNEEVFFLHVLHAFSALSTCTFSGREEAKSALDRARHIILWSTPWERSLFEIAQHIVKRKYTLALSLLERHLLEWPFDLFALKCVEVVSYVRGERCDPHWLEKIVERCYFSCQGESYFSALYARALFLVGKKEYAKQMAERGKEYLLGAHTLIECLFEEHQPKEALEIAKESKDSFLLARCLLAGGEVDSAYEAVQNLVHSKQNIRSILRCAPLFFLLEKHGKEVAWTALSKQFPADFDHLLCPYAAAMHLFTLLHVGSDIWPEILREVSTLTGEERIIWDTVGLRFCEGVRLSMQGNPSVLEEVMRTNPFLSSLGGGDFELLFLSPHL